MCTYPVQPCLHIRLYYYLLSPQYTVLHILFIAHFTPYFYFILTYIDIYSCVMFHFFFFALFIERTCPDLHFCTDYILYN